MSKAVVYDETAADRLIASAKARYARCGAVSSADALDLADQLEAAGRDLELACGVIDSGNEAFRVARAAWATERDALRAEIEVAGAAVAERDHYKGLADLYHAGECGLLAERDALSAEVARLTAVWREMAKSLDDACLDCGCARFVQGQLDVATKPPGGS